MLDLCVSVVVPVYNTEKYVGKCIESLLNQSYRNLEIIIVDDASPGNIKEIVEEYKKNHNNIKLVCHDENKGLFQARITGMRHATGEYFAFVDSDDCVPQDYYRIMVKKAVEKNADIVASDFLEIYEDKFYYPHNMLNQKEWNLQNDEIIDALMKQQGLDFGWWVVWNKLYSIDIWKRVKRLVDQENNHLIMCEDVAFSTCFFLSAKHFVNVHSNYYYYYKGDEASTNKKYTKKGYLKNLQDIEYAFDIAKEALKYRGLWEKYNSNWQQWKNSIVIAWRDRKYSDERLHGYEKYRIEKTMQSMICEEDTNPRNHDKNCCARGVWIDPIDHVADIKRAILDESTKVVSFDIFDTLILRPCMYPQDIFRIIDEDVNKIINCKDFFVFSKIRVRAEQLARDRKRMNSPMVEEVSLQDIYEEIAIMCPSLVNNLEAIKELEIWAEKQYCQARNLCKELLECAVYAGKKVVCISDMYLPIETIEFILRKNNIIGIDKIYLSSELGICKSSGKLYKYVIKDLSISKASEIVHIGDNWDSDVVKAKEYGINAWHIPKTTDMLTNCHGGIYSGNYYYNCFGEQQGFWDACESRNTWGMRALLGVIGNKLYDNPFVFYNRDSDYNGDPYTIGYLCLGLHLLAIERWLIECLSEKNYQNINFIARDGYLIKEAFEIMRDIYPSSIQSYYTYLSRKSILPLMVESNDDYLAIYDNFDLNNLSPSKLLGLLYPIVDEEAYRIKEKICLENDFPSNNSFETLDAYMRFGKVFFEYFYSFEKSIKYRDAFEKVIAERFMGVTATFDVGYSARIESTLARNYGYNITAHYIHTNNDRAFGRVGKSKIGLKTFYNAKPFVTGIMREHMISELGPSCIRYDWDDSGDLVPVFEEYSVNFQTKYVTETIQGAALDFIKDIVGIFGDRLLSFPFRYEEASIPFEKYLHDPKEPDQSIFRCMEFEDDMGIGNHLGFVDFWNHESWRWGSMHKESFKVHGIEYDKYGFITRWLMMLTFDLDEGSVRWNNAIRRHPILLKIPYQLFEKIYTNHNKSIFIKK